MDGAAVSKGSDRARESVFPRSPTPHAARKGWTAGPQSVPEGGSGKGGPVPCCIPRRLYLTYGAQGRRVVLTAEVCSSSLRAEQPFAKRAAPLSFIPGRPY